MPRIPQNGDGVPAAPEHVGGIADHARAVVVERQGGLLRRFRRAPVLEPYSVLSIHAQAHELLRQLYHISVVERHVLLIVPSVEGEALTLYHGQLRSAAHLIHRDVLAVILVVLHRAVHHGIDLRHGNAQLILLVADGHRHPAGQLGRYVPGNIRQQRLRRVAVPTGVGLPGQSPDIPPHLLRQLAIPLRQHVHGALGIRPVRVQIVGAQIAQRTRIPVRQLLRVVHDLIVLGLHAVGVVVLRHRPLDALPVGSQRRSRCCGRHLRAVLHHGEALAHLTALYVVLQRLDELFQPLSALPRPGDVVCRGVRESPAPAVRPVVRVHRGKPRPLRLVVQRQHHVQRAPHPRRQLAVYLLRRRVPPHGVQEHIHAGAVLLRGDLRPTVVPGHTRPCLHAQPHHVVVQRRLA